jgi:hypothetical protein
MSDAGFSLETATSRGGGREWDLEVLAMRVRIEVRAEVRSDARCGFMLIFMLEEGSELV